MSKPATRGAAWFLYALFFLSGSCGLGYQIAWTRMWAVGLGHEVPSILAVVAAFFGGLSLGSWVLDGPVTRSPRPGRWYVGLELLLGLWALVTTWLIPQANDLVAQLTGVLPSAPRQWLVAFGVPFVCLLPATAAMGATLPAMDRFFGRLCASERHVGGLYGANTLGAVAGTLASAFVLVPRLGLTRTVLCFAALNLVCGAAVALGYGRGEERRVAPRAAAEIVPGRGRLYAILFGTGLFGIGFEVVGVRVIGQVLENTVYTFACALAVFLTGTAAGAALYQRFARQSSFDRLLGTLLHATTLACLAGMFAMARAKDVYVGVQHATGSGFAAAITGELAVAAAVFLLPALLMGATFSHLAQGARRSDGGVGAALSVNTVGGAAAPLLFGVALLPALGSKWTLVGIALGYVLLLPQKTPRRLAPAAVAVLLVLLLPHDLRLITPPTGGSVLDQREDVMAGVAVVSDGEGNRYLKVNDRFYMGGSVRGFAARRSGHLPLLLHPAPKRALFLGMGAGTTFGASGWHAGVAVECVELLPAVAAFRSWFQTDEDRFDAERMHVLVADARRFVRAGGPAYDVIVADLFHPARDGAGSLYTLEHFAAIRERLAPGGLFCQWLPLYQMEPETRDLVIRTFLAAFPHVEAFLSDYNVTHPVLGLIGRSQEAPYALPWLERRVPDPALRGALERVALRNDMQLFGGYLGDRAALERLVGDGPVNRDDRPLVTFLAPRQVYAASLPAEENLRALLEMREEVGALLAPGAPASLASRLKRYLEARNRYLQADMADSPEERFQLLLSSVRTSADFATGYHVLLLAAEEAAAAQPEDARQLLDALIASHPQRPEARSVRAELFGY